MSFEQCTFSLESAEGYSQTSSWDTRQLSLLSGSHTPAKSCENEPQKDGSPACMCGKGTLGCSIHPSTPESWTAFMRDSLARTLASLESKQAYLREPEVAFTAKSSESLAWFDRDTCSWRTYQRSLVTDSEPYSQTWPRWGMTVAGVAYEHPMSGRRITETDGSYLPTPVKSDCVARRPSLNWEGKSDLPSVMWRLNGGELNPDMPPFKLNPDFVGWLMGFPIAWANSKATETPKSRSKQPQHGDCSEVAE
jgi:hypothetical protein